MFLALGRHHRFSPPTSYSGSTPANGLGSLSPSLYTSLLVGTVFQILQKLWCCHGTLFQSSEVCEAHRLVVWVIKGPLQLLHKHHPGSSLAITQDLFHFHIRPFSSESFSSNFAQSKEDLCQVCGIVGWVRHIQ